MKKFFVLIIAMFLLVSCSMVIKDPEGWEIFQCGWALDNNQVLIQSHDGYIIDNIIYNEHIMTIYKNEMEECTVIIENRLARQINVKLTYGSKPEIWINIDANSNYVVSVDCF